MYTLTRAQARRFLLTYQNLWPPRSLQGKTGALSFIRRVGCIQFDPLDIIGKNPELVLQSRIADFTPKMLDELLYQDRQLLDGWDKQMAIYPVEDWPYFHRRRQAIKDELPSQDAVAEIAQKILEEIILRGALSSIDLEHNGKVDWWWGPTRLARAVLESMYFGGELIIHHKVHTRKFYDLADRHIPAAIFNAPEPNPANEDYQDWYVLRRLGSVGLMWNRGGATWAGTPVNAAGRKVVLKRLQDHGKILPVQVEEIEYPLYLRTQDKALLEDTLNTTAPEHQAAFIAPLDNLVWERSLLEDLFHFDYRWEVYTPPQKRKYGYYVLPVLYGDRFVARMDAARQKRGNMLMVKDWWWEPGVHPDEAMLIAIQECFERFAAFLSVTDIQLDGRSASLSEVVWSLLKWRDYDSA